MAKTLSPCPSCGTLNRLELSEKRKGTCSKCGTVLGFVEGVTELPPVLLNQVLQRSPLPVLIDFWAPWCGPCVGFAPIFKRVAQSLGDRVLFLKLNTEEAQGPELSNLNIRSIPTLIYFKDGKVVDRVSGALPESELRRWVEAKI